MPSEAKKRVRHPSPRITAAQFGMDQRIAARIFEPFFTTRFMGRGLGLAAVAGIVRSERGAIQVESEVGKGTTFVVFLPAQPVAQTETRRATVLVAEDEDYIRHFMKAAFEAQGFNVMLAEDGRRRSAACH
jgi:two-component system cell cycle sensor histidine kinase/response regulator CckA